MGLYTEQDYIKRELEKRFPWLLDEDEDANGADVVDAIAEWYSEVQS